MQLYVWEGPDLTSAYHDDGTLVILAPSLERARELGKMVRDFYTYNVDRDPNRIMPLDAEGVIAKNSGCDC